MQSSWQAELQHQHLIPPSSEADWELGGGREGEGGREGRKEREEREREMWVGHGSGQTKQCSKEALSQQPQACSDGVSICNNIINIILFYTVRSESEEACCSSY